MSVTRRNSSVGTQSEEEPSGRPVLGAGLLIVAGLLVVLVTWQFTLELLLIGGAYSVIGFAWGALMILCGVLALSSPKLSTPIGVAGIAFSILSIIGALGGLLVGIILGIAGGSLLISWSPDEVGRAEPSSTERDRTPSPSPTGSQGSFSWQSGSSGTRSGSEPSVGTDRSAETQPTGERTSGDDFSFQQGTSSSPSTSPSTSPSSSSHDEEYSFEEDMESEPPGPMSTPLADEEDDEDDEDEYSWKDDEGTESDDVDFSWQKD